MSRVSTLVVCTKGVIRHINGVSRVFDLRNCPVLEEFSVSFPFLQSTSSAAKCEIYKWLKFASSKKIQSLKLDLAVDVHWSRLGEYSFPIELLSSGFKALKKLTLNRVRVDCQAVETLISSCPLLELLSITQSQRLQHLKIVGPSLKLKHLVIRHCPVDSLEIRNVNLVSFTFRGLTKILLLQNATSVLTIDVNQFMCGLFYCELPPKITTNLTQLVMPSVEGYHSSVCCHFGGSFLTFNNFNWLLLRLNYMESGTLLGITPLLEAVPYLQKFIIELHFEYHTIGPSIKDVQEGSICRKTLKSQHQHLTEVQYIGYLGFTSDVELATYLLENALALEKFIVDPRNKSKDTRQNCEGIQRARDLAMLQLQPKVPKGVKLEATDLGQKAKELKKTADAHHQEERSGNKGRKWQKNVKEVRRSCFYLKILLRF